MLRKRSVYRSKHNLQHNQFLWISIQYIYVFRHKNMCGLSKLHMLNEDNWSTFEQFMYF